MPQALSRIEVIEKAARLVRDGELNPALQSYKQLFAQDPTDWAVGNALGDLYLRLGKTDDGIAHFMGLGEQLARDGYTAKARAIYRKILRVQPDNELAGYRVVELDNQHLVEKSQSSPFMKRMLDTARAAAKQQAEIESSADRESSADAPPSQATPSAQDATAPAASSVPAVQLDPAQEQLAAQPPAQPQPAPTSASQPQAAAQPQPLLEAPPSVQPHTGELAMPAEAPPEPHAPPAPQEPPAPQAPPAPPAPQTRPPVPARAANPDAAGEQQSILEAEPPQAQARAAQPVPVVQARTAGAPALQPLEPQNSPELMISFDEGGDDWSAVDLEAAVETPPPVEETAQVLAPEEDDEIAAYEALLRETASEEWNALEIAAAAASVPLPSGPPADATASESIPDDAVLLEASSGEWSPVAFDDAAAPPTIDLFDDAAAPPAIDLASIASEMGSQSFEPLEIVEEVDEIESDAAVEPVSAALRPMRATEAPYGEPIEEAIEFEELPDDWLSMTFQTAVLQLDPELEDEGEEDENARDFHKAERQARRAAARGDFDGATAALESFLHRWPHHVPALETLIDISADGGLEELVSAQVRLAEACMASGRVAQARNVAVDLLRRYPDDSRCQHVVGRIRDLALKRAEPGVAAATPWQVAAPAVTNPAAPSSQMDFVLEALGPEDPLDFPAPLIDQEDGFEEIRIGLLEDVAAVAEERFASGSRLINERDFSQAIGLLEEAVCVPHLRHSGGARLAQAYRESGDCLKALDCLEWAAERPPLNEESGHVLAYELALTLEAIGEPQQALGVYRELLAEVGPTFRDVAARAARLRAA